MGDRSSLSALASRIDGLPLIDRGVHDLLTLLNRPDSNFDSLAARISPDLAVRFLNMANALHPDIDVHSLKHAVSLLGYSEMKQILTTAVMVEHFTGRIDAFSFDRFQRHARFCAMTADMLGTILQYHHPEDLFTASMLTNIGKLVIAVYLPEEHRKIVERKRVTGGTSRSAEKTVLGHGHAELGALVLRRFNVPEAICQAVRHHNGADRSRIGSANFQMESICREAARLVGRFSLPAAADLDRFPGRFQKDLDRARHRCRAKVRRALRENGIEAVFGALLAEAGQAVSDILEAHIPRRDNL